jgi:hypothetical protein
MLALIGKLTNAAIGWALPGISANALYIVAGLLFVGIPSAYAWHKGSEGKAAAIVAERAACEISKAEDARNAALTMADLLDRIAKAETDNDAGKTSKQLCAGSNFCRTRGKK